ncbi:hypothetical protein HZB02_02115 [Candidatus Woesearchaeota archaeon]|nr:hypothetical protein [Candidatus Woesearchaeota archaeon]
MNYKGLIKQVGKTATALLVSAAMIKGCIALNSQIKNQTLEQLTELSEAVECSDGKAGYSNKDVEGFYDRLVDTLVNKNQISGVSFPRSTFERQLHAMGIMTKCSGIQKSISSQKV